MSLTSTAENPNNGFFGGGNSEVTWSFVNSEGEEVASNAGTLGEGQSESLEDTTRDTMPGIWSIVVEVTQGDNVNVENDVTIAYPEGSEDPVNPRTE